MRPAPPPAPLDPLPPPASGLFLEVSFRRLLASCEATAAGTPPPGARPELAGDGWRVSPVFHHVRGSEKEEGEGRERQGGALKRDSDADPPPPRLPPFHTHSTSKHCRSSWPTCRLKLQPNGEREREREG